MTTMESTQNMLVNRQLEVVRKNLVTVFRFTVKALIDKACFSSIDDACEEFVNFSAAMEQVLHHRLRPSKMWHLGDSKNHFWFYIKAACHRHDLRSCINNIDNIENIRTPVGKGRAFLRCALMEKRLAEYLGEAIKQTNVTRRFYQEGAIMLGEEGTELCGVLVGLNSIDFGFCLKGENYDSVPGPLAVNYSPFMKFKQSPESLYSDMEEMRELSCESSLASEDGQEGHDGMTDTWQDRYNMLHKRHLRALEQKSFLEELTASQEKALQAATAAQQEQRNQQQEAQQQQRQYEAVILELQAQIARMKAINESLQRQLTLARHSCSPMSEMEFRGESQADASRFAAAIAYHQDCDQNSFTSSYDHSVALRPVDTRSLTSAMSEMSGDAVPGVSSFQLEGGIRRAEDTQSMVPLTGSLSDLQGQDISSITSIPAETASINMNTYPVVEGVASKSFKSNSHYTSPSYSEDVSLASEGKMSLEVNGNNVSPERIQKSSAAGLSVASAQAGSEPKDEDTEKTEGDYSEEMEEMEEEEVEGRDRRKMASVWHDGLQESIIILRDHSSHYSQEESFVDTDSLAVETPSEVKDLVDDSEMVDDQDAPTSIQDEAVSIGEDMDSCKSEAQQPDIAQDEMEGDREATASGSDKGDGSEPEILSQESAGDGEGMAVSSDKGINSEPEILSQESAGNGSASSSDKGEVSDSEVLWQESAGATEGNAGNADKEIVSEPEILSQESADRAEGETHQSNQLETSEPDLVQGEEVAGDREVIGNGSGSDSCSSDIARDTWDMLSDAKEDSS